MTRWRLNTGMAVALGCAHSRLTPGCTILLAACGAGFTLSVDAAERVTNGAGPMEEVVVVASKIARPLHAVPAQVTVVTAERLAFE